MTIIEIIVSVLILIILSCLTFLLILLNEYKREVEASWLAKEEKAEKENNNFR